MHLMVLGREFSHRVFTLATPPQDGAPAQFLPSRQLMQLTSISACGLDRILPRVRLLLPVVVLAILAACGESGSRSAADTAAVSCGPAVRAVVEQLGHHMRQVSLLAPDSIVRRELASAYEPLVTAPLLIAWQSSPAEAPGREVSNPWPARIEISSVKSDPSGCRVDGDVVYVTSADTTTAVERRRVAIHLRHDGSWRVSAYEASAPSSATGARTGDTGVSGASPAASNAGAPRDSTIANVIQRYYAAIERRDYDAAYSLWSDEGRASGKTRAEFAAGFAQTERVQVTVGNDIAIQGAAGSQYATVPVAVDAVLRDGRRQQFTGTYTLRRAMVDGATPEQRRWRIYKADLRER